MVFAGYKEIKDIVSLLLFWSFIFITFITIHNKMSKNNLTVTLIIKGTFSSKVMKTEIPSSGKKTQIFRGILLKCH